MILLLATIALALQAPAAERAAESRVEGSVEARVEGRADGRVDGRVIDGSRKPVAGARVVLGEFGHATVVCGGDLAATYAATPGIVGEERARWAAETTTDSRGEFHASGLGPGEYSLVATHPSGGIGLALFKIRPEFGNAPTVQLLPPGFLELEVAGLGRDPSKHVVRMDPLGLAANLSIVPKLESKGATWSFTSSGLPAVRAWRVAGTERVIEGSFHATLFSTHVQVQPGETKRIELDLTSGAVEGKVTDAEGKPLAGVSVVARPPGQRTPERGAVTGADGRYAIRGILDGTWELEAQRWILRETPGCGQGFQDAYATRTVTLPLAEAGGGDLKVEGEVPRPRVGQEAPDFAAETVDGRKIELRALRGKVVLLDFWATWCPMCRSEMPALVETYEERAKDGFEIVGISVDDDVGLVPRFVESRGLKWPQIALGTEARNPIARLYNAHSTPMTVLVDRDGTIAGVNLMGKELRHKIGELCEAR